MAEEIKTKKAFYEDIFAEDPEKWSWPGSGPNTKASGSGVNYDTHTSEVKSNSSSSVNSEDGFVFRGDSNSLKRSFRKRGSSSGSEENQEDASSSPRPSGSISRERLLPSIYDDDAQSGSPSGVFEKKDLAFQSSFKKNFDFSPNNRSKESSPPASVSENKVEKHLSDRELSVDKLSSKRSSLSPKRKDSRDGRSRRSPSDKKSKSSRSRSRERRYHRRSVSRSRSKDKRTRSPHSKRRSRSKDRPSERSRRRHSRGRRSPSRESRRRSRSRSYERYRRRSHYRSSSRDRYRRRRYSRSRSHSRDRSKGGSSSRKLGALPLSTSGGAMTPQMALQQTMAAMSAKAQALTGIALPKYYNPAAVNPLKYAEQVQKRKLLWQTKEKEEDPAPKNSVWDKLTFAQDQDGKMTAKFRKLMGIKSEGAAPTEAEEKEAVLKKQEELFRDLDQQYEMARMTTHTQRGVGLGYSAQTLYPPVQK